MYEPDLCEENNYVFNEYDWSEAYFKQFVLFYIRQRRKFIDVWLYFVQFVVGKKILIRFSFIANRANWRQSYLEDEPV